MGLALAQHKPCSFPATQYPGQRFPLLWIFSPPCPVLIDSHPKLPSPKHQQLHQLPGGQNSFDVTNCLLKSINLFQTDSATHF